MLTFVLWVTGCAPVANTNVVLESPGVGRNIPIFVATTRSALSPGRFSPTERGDVSFARYVVSVPPTHQPGQVESARKRPDPATQFVTRETTPLDRSKFRSAVRSAMRANSTNEAVVFVHGFNNSLGDGLYRMAQIKADLDYPGIPIHYAWPSAGNPLAYLRDRDSALYARAGLIDLLDSLAAAGVTRIVLSAHSMGTFLTMETLIWMAKSGNHPGYRALSSVVFLSPDIDVDLFRTQAHALGDLPQPFLIFTSKKDAALKLSARLTGQRSRLGNLSNVDDVADLEVTVIDITQVKDLQSRHFSIAASPSLLALISTSASIGEAFQNDRSARLGILPGTIVSVRNATALIVAPVDAVADVFR